MVQIFIFIITSGGLIGRKIVRQNLMGSKLDQDPSFQFFFFFE